MLHFSIFGIPVQVQWTFWLTMALLNGQNLFANDNPYAFALVLIWIAAAFVSILWHELGHAFLFRKFGYRPSISLYAFGGMATAAGMPRPKEQIRISLAGPIAQFLLFGLLYLVLYVAKLGPFMGMHVFFPVAGMTGTTGTIYLDAFIQYMLIVNLIWPLINLIPMLPLDGGRVMQAMMQNDQKVLKISVVVGFSVALVALFILGSMFMGIMFGYMAFTCLQQLQGIYGGFGPRSGPGPGSYRRR